MCGRYVVKNPVTKTGKLVKSAIQVEDTENYNAHPYQKLPVIKKYKNGNTLEALKWGLIPGWAKDKDFKALINARLETIDEKVSFKKLIKNNRCVAVADGFYGALVHQPCPCLCAVGYGSLKPDGAFVWSAQVLVRFRVHVYI